MNDVLLLAVLQSLDAGDVDTARGLADLAGDDAAIETLLADDVAESVQGPNGPPPFPGAVFDTGRHRWVKGPGGGDPLASMKRRELQKVAMQVGAKTTLKLDEPVEQLKASILAHTAADDATTAASSISQSSTAAKPGYVHELTPDQVKAARDRVNAARSNPSLGDDAKKITDERFAAVADDIMAAVAGHAKTHEGLGPPVAKLYAAVAPNHGLTPDEFRGAVQRLRQSGQARTSGISKSLGDEPRPDLLTVPPSGTAQGWVHPPAQK